MANARQKVDDVLFTIFGTNFDGLPPSVKDALLNSSDMNEGLRAAKEEFQRLASQRSLGTNAPGRSPLEADAIEYPVDSLDSAPRVEIVTGRAESTPKAVSRSEDAPKKKKMGFVKKAGIGLGGLAAAGEAYNAWERATRSQSLSEERPPEYEDPQRAVQESIRQVLEGGMRRSPGRAYPRY